MKNKINLKLLLVSLGICIAMAVLSRFFMPGIKGWSITIAAAISSFIAGYFVSVLFIKGNKKKFVIRRYVLAVLVVLAAVLYFRAYNSIVCVVTEKSKQHDATLTKKKMIITGRALLDSSDLILNRLNETKDRCSICDSLVTHDPARIWTRSSITASENKLIMYFVVLVALLSVLVIHIVEEFLSRGGIRRIELEKKVFISYNHHDKETAGSLEQLLQKNDLDTILDSKDMVAGTDIFAFVKESVQRAAVTLMIVSEKSLLSGWVVTEAINSFFLESFDPGKSFIGCYTEGSFLDPAFTNKAITLVNEKIRVTQQQLDERNALGADSRDLNQQKTRLLTLKANLDLLISRLQNSLCIDIAGGNLEKNFPAIEKAIREAFEKLDE